MKNIISTLATMASVTILTAGLSVSVYADSDTDTNHSTMHATSNTSMPNQGMMKAMQNEMQAIINTEDSTKRKALFVAYKEKFQGMMQMMQGNSNNNQMMGKKKEIDHQGETD